MKIIDLDHLHIAKHYPLKPEASLPLNSEVRRDAGAFGNVPF
jgi:hypothetical protein